LEEDLVFFKHNIDMLCEEANMLENGSECIGFLGVTDNNVHFWWLLI
jgi:hypothetical protein